MTKIKVGIDAANLRSGGGLTHIIELLSSSSPSDFGISDVVVWGSSKALELMPNRRWLQKSYEPVLDQSLPHRALWQRQTLSSRAREHGCDLLFVPGGNFVGEFAPVVTMSRNMLPFDWHEIFRYRFSPFFFKLVLLRYFQTRALRRANGVIFLTKYAEAAVMGVTGHLRGDHTIIPHGINPRFFKEPKPQLVLGNFNDSNPYRIIYVSSFERYKHQLNVALAVKKLRGIGYPIVLDLVGAATESEVKQLEAKLRIGSELYKWLTCHGAVPYDRLHEMYRQADLGVFASSCENMPNITSVRKPASEFPLFH